MQTIVYPGGPDDSYGIEIRDWLAARAMQGILAGNHKEAGFATAEQLKKLAKCAYAVAQAMIDESEQGN